MQSDRLKINFEAIALFVRVTRQKTSVLVIGVCAIATYKSSKGIHRMLSAKGNPTMDNLTAILKVLRETLQVDIKVKTIACA